MKQVFIPTQNFQNANTIVADLLSASYGVDLAVFTGRAGRGKTTTAERIFTTNPNTVYVLYEEGWNYLALLREITFKLCGTRPSRRQQCAEMVERELSARRRVILVDEADRANMHVLNGLRNIHDKCGAPIVLIGEEALTAKLSRERRLISRVRAQLSFTAVTQADVVLFFRKTIEQDLTPAHTARVLKYSGGDFRRVLTAAIAAEKIMATSGLTAITDAVIDKVVG